MGSLDDNNHFGQEVRLASNNEGFWNGSPNSFFDRQTGVRQARTRSSSTPPRDAAIDSPVESKTLAFAASTWTPQSRWLDLCGSDAIPQPREAPPCAQ
jgi:hypothetical protein